MSRVVTVYANGPEGRIGVSFDTDAAVAGLLAERGVGRRLQEAYQLVFETDTLPELSAEPVDLTIREADLRRMNHDTGFAFPG